jgi:predicted nucleic acid-binding protein
LTRFFDTSALAKRYISEPGSELVRTTLRSHEVTVARIAYAELAASLARACRMGAITEAQRDAVFARLALDFSRLNIVEIRAALVTLVPNLVLKHPLRGYDAVQLAAALTVQVSGQSVEFWSADSILCQAATAEGMKVVNPG